MKEVIKAYRFPKSNNWIIDVYNDNGHFQQILMTPTQPKEDAEILNTEKKALAKFDRTKMEIL